MKLVSFVLIIVVVLLGLSFALLNAETVKINYFFGSQSMPLSFLMVITFGLGLLVGCFFGLLTKCKSKRKK